MGKFSYQEVKSIIEKNKYYFLIDKKYNTTKDYLNIIDKYGYKYSTTFTNFKTQIKRNCKLYEFAKYNPYSLYNVLLYIKNNNILITYISGEYISTEKKNLKFLCNNCKKEFYICFDYIRSGRGLCKCKTLWRINGNHNNLEIKFPEISSEWNYDKNTGIPKDFTIGSHKYKNWICKDCGYKWICKISNRTSGKNCPNCASSKGEKRISEYLLNNNIKFETQYKGFKNCKNIRILSFDFYISKLNILIEYDGILHYKDKFNKPIEFKKTKKNDKIKTKYCKDNDIKLIRIPYWNFDNIENILKTTLL